MRNDSLLDRKNSRSAGNAGAVSARRPGYNPRVSDEFIIIEFRRAGSKAWEHLGRYKTSASELVALKAHLARCVNAYQLLDRIPKKGLIWETLNILKSEGRFARIRFPD